MTRILRFAQNDRRGTLESDKGGGWRMTRILRFAQNDRGGTLEGDKDSSAVPQNDRGGTLEDDKDSSAVPQNDKGGRSIPLVTLSAAKGPGSGAGPAGG